MINSKSRFDPGFFAVLAICLLVTWPFLSWPDIAQETDAELHIFRTVELNHIQGQGLLYTRWAPDLYFGYGYPIFNYYAPLVYYLASTVMFLVGANAVLAVKITFVLGLFSAGFGMYAFANRYWGRGPGLLAAATFVCAPYIQYIDPYARGVLAESFSFGLFPWVLWSFSRLDSGIPRRRIPLAAGLLAALICTHNLMALVFSAILAAWILWLAVQPASEPVGRLFIRIGRIPIYRSTMSRIISIILGIALASFFWLPVLLERDLVQLGNLISDGGHFDFRNHFLSISEILGPTIWLDWGATEPHYAFNLGIPQWILGILGCGVLVYRKIKLDARQNGLYFGLAAVLLLLTTLPVSSPIWEIVPFMPFLQFPWRLLGPLALCLGVLAAIALSGFESILKGSKNYKLNAWLAALLVGLLLIFALPLTYPAKWPDDFGSTDLWALNQKERTGRWLGTTSTGDYVPKYVKVVPDYSDQVRDSYGQGGMIDRVNRVTLPVGTTVMQTGEKKLTWSYKIDGQKAFVFRLFHFYFPGWIADLDGETVPIKPAKPDGFMTVEIPAGPHELVFSFHDTPARKLAWSVSGLAALVCIVGMFVPQRKPVGKNARKISPIYWKSFYPLILIPLAVLVFKIVVSDPMGWFHYESAGLEVEIAENTISYQIGDSIALIGYDLKPNRQGGTLELTLYWKALDEVPDRYQVFVHLRDSSGAVVAQSDKLNPGNYPTSRWPLDKYIRDQHTFTIPADLPDGEYKLAIGLWHMSNSERLPVRDASGIFIGDSIILETLTY
ncbi:MAG: hypothetical protein JXA42_03570 [Anaerolineales bacterium]|nr:hypothetical protein [Anaerolineales bacterium]